MATEQAPERLPETTHWTIEHYSLQSVFRARRIEATTRWEKRRHETLVASQQRHQCPRADHGLTPSPPLTSGAGSAAAAAETAVYRGPMAHQPPHDAPHTPSHMRRGEMPCVAGTFLADSV